MPLPVADLSFVAAAALAALAAILLLMATGRDPQRRAWALIAIAGAALYFVLNTLPRVLPGARELGTEWNWSGNLLAVTAMAALALALNRRLGLPARAFGLVRPSALPSAVGVTVAALLVTFALNAFTGDHLTAVSLETWLFLATIPGPVEEFAFRGVLLAAAERAAPACRTVAGAPISLGAVALTLAFVALHGATLGTLVSVLPAALLYLWLRARTGSVLVPAVAHNLWNLTVLIAHL